MSWIELHITTTAEKADLLSEELSHFGANAVTFQDGGDEPIFEPTPTTARIWGKTVVIGLFAKEDMNETILNHFSKEEVIVKEVAETDWVRLTLDRFQPIQFGDRLWICPSWQKPVEPNAVNVILDPGLAFGTGSHPTTALCLEWLEKNKVKDCTVIDYGCGSGILGIAAYKLGAAKVYAVDHDPNALDSALNNARQNDIQGNDFIALLPENMQIEPADIVIANILAGPLLALCDQLASLTKPGGYIVLSGILANQVQNITKSYNVWYNVNQPVFKDEWALLEGIRANNN